MGRMFFVLLFTLCSFTISAQQFGTIYTSSEALNLFGSVENYTEISPSELKSIAEANQDKLFFQFINEEAYIFNAAKEIEYGANTSVSTPETYYVYSTQKVMDLLNLSNGQTIFLEKRANHLTLSGGGYTLEDAALCPPFCD